MPALALALVRTVEKELDLSFGSVLPLWQELWCQPKHGLPRRSRGSCLERCMLPLELLKVWLETENCDAGPKLSVCWQSVCLDSSTDHNENEIISSVLLKKIVSIALQSIQCLPTTHLKPTTSQRLGNKNINQVQFPPVYLTFHRVLQLSSVLVIKSKA